MFIENWIYLLVLICASVTSNGSEEYEELPDPKCQPLWLLVELPFAHKKVNYKLSTTHALVRRCMGINNLNKTCVSNDKVVKMEEGYVTNVIAGTNKNEFINVSWVSHEVCKYRKRVCSYTESRKCLAKSTTHYYDEANCTCKCIVNIDHEVVRGEREETCPAKTLMEFSLDSDKINSSTKSKKEKAKKNYGGNKCWHLPNLLAARSPPRLAKSMVKNGNYLEHKWPLLDPITHLIIEAGTSFIILRWYDPLTRKSEVTIEAFRINWMSKKEKIKTREIEASKIGKPERKMCIQDLHPDTDYAVAIFIKLKSEDFFSRPTIRKVKTLSSNEDSMIFHLGDIEGEESSSTLNSPRGGETAN